jgi:hypothetical protein
LSETRVDSPLPRPDRASIGAHASDDVVEFGAVPAGTPEDSRAAQRINPSVDPTGFTDRPFLPKKTKKRRKKAGRPHLKLNASVLKIPTANEHE